MNRHEGHWNILQLYFYLCRRGIQNGRMKMSCESKECDRSLRVLSCREYECVQNCVFPMQMCIGIFLMWTRCVKAELTRWIVFQFIMNNVFIISEITFRIKRKIWHCPSLASISVYVHVQYSTGTHCGPSGTLWLHGATECGAVCDRFRQKSRLQ